MHTTNESRKSLRTSLPVRAALLVSALLVFTFFLLYEAKTTSVVERSKAEVAQSRPTGEIHPAREQRSATTQGLSDFISGVQLSRHNFDRDYKEAYRYSSEEIFDDIRTDIQDILSDATSLQDRTESAERSCISSSTDETVQDHCIGLNYYLFSAASHLSFVDALQGYPNSVDEQLRNDDTEWLSAVSGEITVQRQTLDSILANPQTATDSGISLLEIRPLLGKAEHLYSRAIQLRESNPVLTLILLEHASLLCDDLGFRTHSYVRAERSQTP